MTLISEKYHKTILHGRINKTVKITDLTIQTGCENYPQRGVSALLMLKVEKIPYSSNSFRSQDPRYSAFPDC